MKHPAIILLCCTFLCAGSLSAHVVNMNGTSATIDTITSYRVGPGTYYTALRMTKGSKIRNLFVIDADLTNPYTQIQTVNGKDQLGSTETLSSMYARMSQTNRQPVAGTNCSFWCVSGTITPATDDPLTLQLCKEAYSGLLGQPLDGTAADGVLITDPNTWNRGHVGENKDSNQEMGYFYIDDNNRATCEDVAFQGVITHNGNTFSFADVNRPREYIGQNNMTLYNRYMGTNGTRHGACAEIVFTVDEWKINETMTASVTAVNMSSQGGTILTGNQGAIQGFGTAATYLSDITVGDQITIDFNIYPRPHPEIRPHIKQMVSGNGLVMNHGQLTWRNWNDGGYNDVDYPRTVLSTNQAGDHVWWMSVQNPGLTTEEMCYILQSWGVYSAASMDGGGSAQTDVWGENMFKTTEATPRGVANAIWVVSSEPKTIEVGQLDFVDAAPITMPSYATYTPQVRAFTPGGTYLTSDYTGHTLSCEPATLGTISADGLSFTASPANGTGTLIATAPNHPEGAAHKGLNVQEGEVRIHADSIVLGNRDYEVEVEAISGDLVLPLMSKALTWEVLDANTHCTISDEGILHAVSDGQAFVVGSLAGFSDTLNVQIETAKAPRMANSTEKWNAQYKQDSTFAFSNTRNAAITMPLNMRLWGTPDTILLVINTDAPVQSLEMAYHAAGQEADKMTFSGKPEANVDYTFALPVDKLFEPVEQRIFPITLESGKFSMKDPKKSKSYTLHIKDIILCYRDWTEVTALPTQLAQPAKPLKLMVNGQVYIIKNNHIYDLKGHEIQ